MYVFDCRRQGGVWFTRLGSLHLLCTYEEIHVLSDLSQVFVKLALWRYKYLHKKFEEELRKIVNFLKGFSLEERDRLSMFVAVAVLDGLANPGILKTLKNEHLVKEGLSLSFVTHIFKHWLREKDIGGVASLLKKANLEQDIMVCVCVCVRACVRV